jgi:hypothetical protein
MRPTIGSGIDAKYGRGKSFVDEVTQPLAKAQCDGNTNNPKNDLPKGHLASVQTECDRSRSRKYCQHHQPAKSPGIIPKNPASRIGLTHSYDLRRYHHGKNCSKPSGLDDVDGMLVGAVETGGIAIFHSCLTEGESTGPQDLRL